MNDNVKLPAIYSGNQKFADELSKVGEVRYSLSNRVMGVIPKVETITVWETDDDVSEDIPLDLIPPHQKWSMTYYFYNRESVMPFRGMYSCISPGVMEQYTGKKWIAMKYNPEWEEFESYLADFTEVTYPFVVNVTPITERVYGMVKDKDMQMFRELIKTENATVDLQLFIDRYALIFHREKWIEANLPQPFNDWMEIAGHPGRAVDIIGYNNHGEKYVVATVPPLISYDSIINQDATVSVSRAAHDALVNENTIKGTGDAYLTDLVNSVNGITENQDHMAMWDNIGKLFGFKMFPNSDEIGSTEEEKVHEVAKLPGQVEVLSDDEDF